MEGIDVVIITNNEELEKVLFFFILTLSLIRFGEVEKRFNKN